MHCDNLIGWNKKKYYIILFYFTWIRSTKI